MKRTAIFLSCLVLSVALMAGCSDKSASITDLSTSPELASVGQEEAVTGTNATKKINIKEEYWDGVSPILVGHWYRFRSAEEVERAYKDMPEILMSFREAAAVVKQPAEKTGTIPLMEKEALPLREKDIFVPLDYPLGQELAKIMQNNEQIKNKIKNEENSTALAETAFAFSESSVTHVGYTQYPNQVRTIIDTDCTVYWLIPVPNCWKIPGVDELVDGIWGYNPLQPETYMEGHQHAGVYRYWRPFETDVTIAIHGDFYTIPSYSFPEDHPTASYTEPGYCKGDCDLNGVWTVYDLLRILDFISSTPAAQVGPEQFTGDVQDDGDCDVNDLTALMDILSVYSGFPTHPILSGVDDIKANIDFSSLFGRIRTVLIRHEYKLDTAVIEQIRGMIRESMEK